MFSKGAASDEFFLGHCYSGRQATLTAQGEDGDLGCSFRGAGNVPSLIKEELKDHWACGPRSQALKKYF